MIRRQEEFRASAEYVARAWVEARSVQKVVLFGSVASPLEREARAATLVMVFTLALEAKKS